MFGLFYTTPGEVKGTIKVRKPIWGLGNFEDIDGQVWNVKANFGTHVSAKRIEALHPYYTDTSGRGFGGVISETWEPYWVEVVEEEKEDAGKSN